MITMLAAGVMSGTSCDGMAAAVVRLSGTRPRVRLFASVRLPYPPAMRKRLLRLAAGGAAPAAEFARAGVALADCSLRALRRAATVARLPLRRLAAVGVHGHTLVHRPGERPPVTWQSGDLSRIAEGTGVTVVGDFRTRDVAAGGQGAPLAPWAHHILFAHPRESRLILNLGGIANVTWLPAGGKAGAVRAFDTGPANMLMDLLVAARTRGRLAFDAGGRLAARGRVHAGVLRRLLAHPFFRRRPPKSTGREEFGAMLLPAFRNLSAPDALATATAFSAESVARQVGRWLPGARGATVYAGGGGARNPVLMHDLGRALAPRPLGAVTALGMPEEALESVCFALLAWARLRGIPNVLPAVTGARRAVSAGVIVPAR